MTRKRAAIYARYSAGPQQTDQSLEGQIRVCTSFIEGKGYILTHTYQDHHITGTSDRRPAFQEMIEDAEKRRFDVLVVYSSDRFSRNKYDSVVYKSRLRKAGVEICYAAENIPDGPEGILLESLMEGWAQYYSEELSRKVKRGMRESASKGKTTGPKPIGYKTGPDKKIVIDENGAKVVREIFTRFLEGATMSEISRELSSKGHLTKKGNPYSSNTIRKILANEKYIGKGGYDGIEIDGLYPPIISEEDFTAAQIRLRENKPHRPKGDFRLTGKLYCGVCGTHYTGTSGTDRRGRRHYYYKSSCKHLKPIPRDALERLVIDETRKALSRPEEIEALAVKILALQEYKKESDPETRALEEHYKRLDAEARRIMAAVAEGPVSDRMIKRLNEIDNELLPEIDLQIKERQLHSRTLSEEQIREGVKAFLAGSDEMLFGLIYKVTVDEEFIRIWFNLTGEDGEPKVSDLIRFDQKELCSTNSTFSRIEASPYGFFIRTAKEHLNNYLSQ